MKREKVRFLYERKKRNRDDRTFLKGKYVKEESKTERREIHYQEV